MPTFSLVITELIVGNPRESGHEVVGYVAQAFLGLNTLAFVRNTLDSQYRGQLGPAALWADQIKYTRGWTWSKGFHFVDAHDDPLGGSCSVSDSRDCKGNCILSAITNYTSRVQDTTLPVSEQDIALKFLIHFIGDIGQPLHCEAYEVGGNSIKEIFDGSHTELHAIWDTKIPDKTIKNSFSGITDYADSLVNRIKSGDYASVAASWISCTDPSSLQPKLIENPALGLDSGSADFNHMTPMLHSERMDLHCPLVWAQDSNALVCSTVFTGYDDSDLGGDYYNNNAPVVDQQLAKSGYRLAAWLNTIFDGTALPRESRQT
ncbi:hypothetical protein BS47DRAFT_590929 [Hydnum rufescens UP504]|uniref:Nuclease S1 n=1 Tax=Hydnum rufescens UP504 TaxID=1448309 RepID=A0A9P6DZQ6_9AGAM|nr:hypothetical protein BS47DRAFT_590929 [Hydnum rufescens UP504]